MDRVVQPECAIVLDGRRVTVRSRPTTFDEVGPITVDPAELTEAQRRTTLRLALRADIESIDGEGMRLAMADRLMADPAVLADVLHVRNAYYERARAAGSARAHCPHCPDGRVPITLLGYTMRFGSLAPRLVADDPQYLLPPSRAYGPPFAERAPGAPLTKAFDFDLPSTLLDGAPPDTPRSGVLAVPDPRRAEGLWERWAPDGVNQPDDRVWWRRGNPCFVALVAVTCALRVLGRGTPTPVAVSKLAAADVYFLDALVHFARCVEIPANAMPDACPACGGSFFPVL